MSQPPLSRLGRYELLEILGHGAMGVVYKAHDAFLDRTVAVKTYRQDVPITDNVKRRFDREVRTASKLVHPNIVMVYDGGLEAGTPFLAMEYVEGPTLASEINRHGRLPLDQALTILSQICEGLAYAHDHDVVHRDLKPANILLTTEGQVKIADFGVAKLLTSDTSSTITPVGTPSYMAPEQIEGKAVDIRTDVFAIAILAYELLTGRQPFGGETWTAVLFQIMNEQPPPPSSINHDLPRAADELIHRALEKDPAKRTPDVRAFAADLRRAFASGKAAAPIALDREIRPGDSLDGGDFEGFRDLSRPRSRPSSRDTLIAIFIVVSLLTIGLLALLVRSRGPSRGTPVPIPVGTAVVPAEQPTAPAATHAPTPRPKPTEAPTPRPRPTEVPTVAPAIPARPPTVAPARPTMEPTVPRVRPTLPVPSPRPRPTREPRPAEPVAPQGEAPEPAVPALPPPVSHEAASLRPSMDVISEPAGAEVVVDGRVKGRTPVRISDLEAGHHDFEVRKEGYISYKKTTDLEPNNDYEMRVVLPSAMSTLKIVSQPPGATIKVDGIVKGQTPLTLGGLESGSYEVSGELESFPTQKLRVDMKGGEQREIRFTFGAGAE